MSKNAPLELRVGVDVGCHSHNVAIGLTGVLPMTAECLALIQALPLQF